mmetsp:Transcript_14729/g.19418  ORF Transcript_14729/g.19418 Transcript_14729/m.19418 type:complete len:154 (+) Transcript_14729:148-609(+)|eukprot:CAMPEP_0117738356 /NCGR_PEP_ID=MMETSP0947-20121206/3076_1 /TAXON_ID=44440 /ORGANISM="Chattonella subsalsa, Strain CCMP2191" /LENGTH=153 /DNA_ID=CAMNT_0005554021 /DNA_START=142 /DNA_END=603 /DNA_ORIENTATION=+
MFVLRVALLACLVLVASAFMMPNCRPQQINKRVVTQATSDELYEAAAACANGDCAVDLVENLESLLEERKVELVAELSKVCSLEKSLKDIGGESELQQTIRAIGRLFMGKADNNWPEGMGTFPFSDDPKKAQDYWDYDLAWKNYYAKIEKEVK